MVEIKGINFEVEITKKRIRNIYLRVDGEKIEATCPYYTPDYEVYNFINRKRDWIYNSYNTSERKKKNSLVYRGGDKFYIFGMEYRLIRIIGKKNIVVTNDTIYFTYKDDSIDSIKALYKYLDNRLLIMAEEYFEKYRNMLIDYGYNEKPTINAKLMTSKWGVCYTRNNKINISSYLIHYPLQCLEYIMVHEMTHFIIPNHSKRFYEIVANNMPDYKQANSILKG